jgi:peptide deformylase
MSLIMGEIREIVQLGAKVLRLTAQAVEVHSEATQKIIADMHATLTNTQGVGIAAPQIGESVQIIIVASRPTARYAHAPLMSPTVMMNPSFQPLSDDMEKDWEGCLSVPSIRALVPRYTAIKIHYLDEQGNQQNTELHGFVARVFQHEFDHLYGKVFLDSVENNQDIVAESEYLKIGIVN